MDDGILGRVIQNNLKRLGFMYGIFPELFDWDKRIYYLIFL
jgi:hypothetical protein